MWKILSSWRCWWTEYKWRSSKRAATDEWWSEDGAIVRQKVIAESSGGEYVFHHSEFTPLYFSCIRETSFQLFFSLRYCYGNGDPLNQTRCNLNASNSITNGSSIQKSFRNWEPFTPPFPATCQSSAVLIVVLAQSWFSQSTSPAVLN